MVEEGFFPSIVTALPRADEAGEPVDGYQMGTRYPIPCIAVVQPGGYVAGFLDALGPCVITHLGDALWRRLSDAIGWRD